MSFLAQLEQNAAKNRTLACFEIIPDFSRAIFSYDETEKVLTRFFGKTLDWVVKTGFVPNAIRLDYSFFRHYGPSGLRAMEFTIQKSHVLGFPVILNVKHAKTEQEATEHAWECFGLWKADAVVLNHALPDLALNSFLDWCQTNKKGVYVRPFDDTSQPFVFSERQEQTRNFFSEGTKRILEHSKDNHSHVGLLVPTQPFGLFEETIQLIGKQNPSIPLLVPEKTGFFGAIPKIVDILKKSQVTLEHTLITSGPNFSVSFDNNAGNLAPETGMRHYLDLHNQSKY